MSNARRDDWLTDAQGRALAGAEVYYCYPQPADTDTVPPSPLATIYSDLGGTPLSQPVITDGFGHAVAYADSSRLYTIVYVHPLFGEFPVILKDQSFGGGGGGGATPFAGVPTGTIDGSNKVFTFAVPAAPVTPPSVWCNYPLIDGLGFTYSWASGTLTITYANAPQPASGDQSSADSLYVQGWY